VYDRYMAKTPLTHPGSSSEIELSRIEANADQLPLLMSQQGYFDGTPPRAVSRQAYQQTPPGGATPPPPLPSNLQQQPRLMQGQYPPAPSSYREAPLHRPHPHNRQPSNLSQHSQQAPSYSAPHSRQLSGYSVQGSDAQNMAGRGTYRS
jgi:hypothetical protein